MIYFLAYPLLPKILIGNPDYILPFRLAGIYLLFLHVFAFLLILKKSDNLKEGINYFFSFYKFWKLNWPHPPTKINFHAPGAKKVHIRGDFNSWSMTELKPDKSKKGSWTVSLKLKAGIYRYVFCVDGKCSIDRNKEVGFDEKHFGKIHNKIVIHDFQTFPNMKVDTRNNFGRSLIIVAGFVLAFIAKEKFIYLDKILLLAIGSIISGVLYSFILSGGMGIADSKGDSVIIYNYHESFMEICLNLQVVLLIISLSLLIHLE
jgi:hypothetical protein